MADNPKCEYVDVNKMPDYVKERLAAATLEFMKDLLKQPEGRAMLEKEKRERSDKNAVHNL